MGLFATHVRAGAPDGTGAGGEPPEGSGPAVPVRFAVVGEALAPGSGSDMGEACTVLPPQRPQAGAPLAEPPPALRATWGAARGTDPAYAAVRALCRGWSDATLAYLHQLSCEDPLTGLAGPAHVRARLGELYRGATATHRVRDSHALVVVDLAVAANPGDRAAGLTRALRAGRLGGAARTVFPGAETIGLLGPARVVVVAARDGRIGQRVALLRRMLVGLAPAGRDARVWIEGLPDDDGAAARLLDELARS